MRCSGLGSWLCRLQFWRIYDNQVLGPTGLPKPENPSPKLQNALDSPCIFAISTCCMLRSGVDKVKGLRGSGLKPYRIMVAIRTSKNQRLSTLSIT